MKKKIIYLLVLIFSMSLFSAAKHLGNDRNKTITGNQADTEKCKKSSGADNSSPIEFILSPLHFLRFNY